MNRSVPRNPKYEYYKKKVDWLTSLLSRFNTVFFLINTLKQSRLKFCAKARSERGCGPQYISDSGLTHALLLGFF